MRYWSQRAILSIGLTLVGFAMASLTLISPSTAYPQLGIALFVLGVGLGLAFTAASDVILTSVMPERAGAAAAVSETGYELGMALGIAILGSIVTGVYRGLAIPSGTSDEVASHARGLARRCASRRRRSLPADQAQAVVTAAKNAFSDGLAIAAGIGSAVLLASAAGRVAAAQAPSDATTRSAGGGRHALLEAENVRRVVFGLNLA